LKIIRKLLSRGILEKNPKIFPAIRKTGVDCEMHGDFITLSKLKSDDERRQWFASNDTIILGVNINPNLEGNGGSAKWEFDISQLPKNLVSAHLKIITFRTHGGLHTPAKIAEEAINKGCPKKGCVFINDEPVDNIHLMKQMPYGKDYGFNRIDPYPITNWIKKCQKDGKHSFTVTLQVDPQVYWDIDEVSIESLVHEQPSVRQWVWMFTGALLGALLGAIIDRLFTRFFF